MEGPAGPQCRPISGFDLLHIPYEERWEHLKNIIVDVYLGQNGSSEPLTLPKLAKFMKENHGFSAHENQYRHRLKKWNIRKRTIKKEKEDIVTILGKRNRDGPRTSTSDVQIRQGWVVKEVDTKQLKRYLHDNIRHQPIEALSPGIFSRWNLPYAAYRTSIIRDGDHTSPLPHNPPTPSYLSINSPEATTPGGHQAKSTPTTALIRKRTLQTRANLLLLGRREDLLGDCNTKDRSILSGWLHDYWIHSFVTAKFWGKGPREWTAGMIAEIIDGEMDFRSSQGLSPQVEGVPVPSPRASGILQPTSLCRWVIHYQEDMELQYDSEPSPPREEQAEFELHDQSSWTDWPASELQHRTLQSTMEESFTQSRFSATSVDDLPISNELVAQAVSKSPDELALDSCVFAIMAGNLTSVSKVLRRPGIGAIDPYHLAASFLDGGHTCCMVMNDLIHALRHCHPIALNNVNSDGHTVLDSLMVSILRSHTNLLPAEVSASFSQSTRFPGEEKDICGRWDAHSPAVRRLHKDGHPRIPRQWKHHFCHSAVQAVCHSMLSIFAPSSSPKIDTLSGLFGRRCTNCGLEMKLGPLHVLVVVAFYLAERGMDGETLFGPVACMVCLLVLGADPDLKAELSVVEFLSSATDGECHHRSMNAMELAEQIPQSLIDRWNSSCKIGWRCLSLILRRAAVGLPRQPESSLPYQSSMVFNDTLHGRIHEDSSDEAFSQCQNEQHCCELFDAEDHQHYKLPCMPQLGALWASIQTEFLTYRKITSLDPNVSGNFQMSALERWLEGETDTLQTPLVADGMMLEYSPCGWFYNKASMFVSKACDVSARYFMNMDVWERATFVDSLLPVGCEIEG